jgi:hypothetical protein
VHSDSAPGADGQLAKHAVTPPDPADDPVRRLAEGPPAPVRRLGPRHWLAGLGLVAGIAAVAFVLPQLIDPATSPTPRNGAAPLGSTLPSPVQPAAPSTTDPSGPAVTGTPSRAPTPADATRPTVPGATTERTPPHGTTRASAPAAGATTHKFTPITLQAEAGSLSDGAAAVDCDTCASGARVRYVGRVDVRARIPSPGTYHLTVVYEADGQRHLTVSIDHGAPIASRAVTGSGWAAPVKLTLQAALPAGTVDIGLYADHGNAPDIDAVMIS